MNPKHMELVQRMHQRVKALHGLTPNAHLQAELDAKFTALLGSQVSDAEQAELIRAAWNDPVKRRELCELRVDTVNNFIRAEGLFLANFFSEVPLGPADRPVVQNTTKQEIEVSYVSQDGRPRGRKTINPTGEEFVDLAIVSSERVGYFMRDIYNGNIANVAQNTFDIAFDLTFKIDRLAKDLMHKAVGSGGVYGDFVTTGTRHNRVYAAHSGINTSNLPPTNDIVLSTDYVTGSSGKKWFEYWGASKGNGDGTNGTSNDFRLDVPKATVNYCNRWANTLNGPLRPTGVIIVPSGDSTGLAGEVSPTGTMFNTVAESLLHNFQTIPNYLGVNWVLIPDATLPPGVCYPVLNRPVGRYYTKADWEQEFIKTEPEKNWEERSQQKLVGLAIRIPDRVHAVRVRYTEA